MKFEIKKKKTKKKWYRHSFKESLNEKKDCFFKNKEFQKEYNGSYKTMNLYFTELSSI
jgi:hypothetical protein